MVVEFITDDARVNGRLQKKGDTMSVSSSIATKLLDEGSAKEHIPEKKKKKSKTDDEK